MIKVSRNKMCQGKSNSPDQPRLLPERQIDIRPAELDCAAWVFDVPFVKSAGLAAPLLYVDDNGYWDISMFVTERFSTTLILSKLPHIVFLSKQAYPAKQKRRPSVAAAFFLLWGHSWDYLLPQNMLIPALVFSHLLSLWALLLRTPLASTVKFPLESTDTPTPGITLSL